jgi:hypothetical protein
MTLVGQGLIAQHEHLNCYQVNTDRPAYGLLGP